LRVQSDRERIDREQVEAAIRHELQILADIETQFENQCDGLDRSVVPLSMKAFVPDAMAEAVAAYAARGCGQEPASEAPTAGPTLGSNLLLAAHEIGSASYEVRLAAARFDGAVRDASREIGFVAGSVEHLFDAFRLLAAQALGSPEVNQETIRSLAALGEPADILAAIFVQKSCVDAPGFKKQTEAAGHAFVEAVAKTDPMVVAWIVAAVAQVKLVTSR
jgi:hypothetical protein